MPRLVLGLFALSVAACASPVEYWKDHMVTYGERYCQSGDNYYDAARVRMAAKSRRQT